jgi:hypothetical protein
MSYAAKSVNAQIVAAHAGYDSLSILPGQLQKPYFLHVYSELLEPGQQKQITLPKQ